MTALGLGDVARVPVRRPAGPRADHRRRAAAGGAAARSTTPTRTDRARRSSRRIGRRSARLPVDPRLGRMVLEAERLGCAARGAGHRVGAVHPGPARAARRTGRQQADEPHGRFADERLRLPRPASTCGATSRSSRRRCPRSAFRRMCKSEYLHYLRIREWQDVHSQLRHGVPGSRARHRADAAPDDADPTGRAPGAARGPALARRAARRREARVPRRARRPVRHLARLGAVQKPPQWVMAAELVETTRLWARVDAPHRARVGRGARRAPRQAHATASRTGRRDRARRWRTSG